jgi:UPF0176 protein
MTYINISGYLFTKLDNLDVLQQGLKENCTKLGLKGTILLGTEGINAFVCGIRSTIDAFYQYISELGFAKIPFKESPSQHVPFNRMVVRIKPEIVTMGVPEISPSEQPAPPISAQMFKHWLDENKDMILLDTRNRYEIELGKFNHAIELEIDQFRDFPQAIQTLPEEYKNKTVVTYCTGGIRGEKAALLLLSKGFKEVYQLQGGILKYFEEYGQAHFAGECFVFDKRISVNTHLEETQTIQCHACRHPVTAAEQLSSLFIADRSCPHCHQDE